MNRNWLTWITGVLVSCGGMARVGDALGPDEWSQVTCVPSDLPTEMLFDTVQPVDDFETTDTRWLAVLGGQNAHCRVTRSAANPHNGSGSLLAAYDFRGKPDYEAQHGSHAAIRDRSVS